MLTPGAKILTTSKSFGPNLRYPLGILMTPRKIVTGISVVDPPSILISWCITNRFSSDVPTVLGVIAPMDPPGSL